MARCTRFHADDKRLWNLVGILYKNAENFVINYLGFVVKMHYVDGHQLEIRRSSLC